MDDVRTVKPVAWYISRITHTAPVAHLSHQDKVIIRTLRMAICTIHKMPSRYNISEHDMSRIRGFFKREDYTGIISRRYYTAVIYRVLDHLYLVRGGLSDSPLSYLAESALMATLWEYRVQYPLDSIRDMGGSHHQFQNIARGNVRKLLKMKV